MSKNTYFAVQQLDGSDVIFIVKNPSKRTLESTQYLDLFSKEGEWDPKNPIMRVAILDDGSLDARVCRGSSMEDVLEFVEAEATEAVINPRWEKEKDTLIEDHKITLYYSVDRLELHLSNVKDAIDENNAAEIVVDAVVNGTGPSTAEPSKPTFVNFETEKVLRDGAEEIYFISNREYLEMINE